ncbi:MAG TPA: hypothetical protein VKE22_00615 [Haliangiales bacterium]|nr:hypothetical protein [Haliangiales bacterium]
MQDLDDSEIHMKRHGSVLGFDKEVHTFSSWPDAQEEQLRVFEVRMRGAAQSSWNIGLIAGIGFGVLVLLIIVAFWGEVDTSLGIRGGPAASTSAPAPGAQPAASPSAAPPATAQPAAAPTATPPPAAAPATPK